jgi:putative ABC transport system ATP-binding protein
MARGEPGVQESVLRMVEVDRVYRRGAEEVHALRGFSQLIVAGEMVALVGPSGCGKSTTLNLASGVDRPDRGRVVVCGIDVAAADERDLLELRRRRVGMVFQAFHLVPHLTAAENVALPLALAGRREPERVTGLLDRVGLGHRTRHLPSQLSGGEQQRTAIARALVHGPDLVVADEPTGNLDSHTGGEVLGLLDELRREHGVAVLLATHDRAVAAAADRVVSMRDGAVVEDRG